ncbi:MAG: SRPBCC family protein [bacterium]
MAKPAFVYTTFIATTAEQLWAALTSAEYTPQYWNGRFVESDWRQGSVVTYWESAARKTLDITGEVLRAEPPHRLAFTFQSYPGGEVLREAPSRVAFEIVSIGNGVVKLTLVHDEFPPDSPVLSVVSRGWPAILSNLKTLLERGTALPFGDQWPDGEPQPVKT